jgi:hypothetical protein
MVVTARAVDDPLRDLNWAWERARGDLEHQLLLALARLEAARGVSMDERKKSALLAFYDAAAASGINLVAPGSGFIYEQLARWRDSRDKDSPALDDLARWKVRTLLLTKAVDDAPAVLKRVSSTVWERAEPTYECLQDAWLDLQAVEEWLTQLGVYQRPQPLPNWPGTR